MCTRALKRERFVPSTSRVLRNFALTVGDVKLSGGSTGYLWGGGGKTADFLTGNGTEYLMSTCIIYS